jgi:hypothetical protein
VSDTSVKGQEALGVELLTRTLSRREKAKEIVLVVGDTREPAALSLIGVGELVCRNRSRAC